jgi:hypothetical protein
MMADEHHGKDQWIEMYGRSETVESISDNVLIQDKNKPQEISSFLFFSDRIAMCHVTSVAFNIVRV